MEWYSHPLSSDLGLLLEWETPKEDFAEEGNGKPHSFALNTLWGHFKNRA